MSSGALIESIEVLLKGVPCEYRAMDIETCEVDVDHFLHHGTILREPDGECLGVDGPRGRGVRGGRGCVVILADCNDQPLGSIPRQGRLWYLMVATRCQPGETNCQILRIDGSWCQLEVADDSRRHAEVLDQSLLFVSGCKAGRKGEGLTWLLERSCGNGSVPRVSCEEPGTPG